MINMLLWDWCGSVSMNWYGSRKPMNWCLWSSLSDKAKLISGLKTNRAANSLKYLIKYKIGVCFDIRTTAGTVIEISEKNWNSKGRGIAGFWDSKVMVHTQPNPWKTYTPGLEVLFKMVECYWSWSGPCGPYSPSYKICLKRADSRMFPNWFDFLSILWLFWFRNNI